MKLEALDYALPEALIAHTPPAERDGGRLMVLDRFGTSDARVHDHVRNLASWVPRDAVVVVNDSRVIPARLEGHKPTGGRVEVLLVRTSDPRARVWKAMGRANKPLAAGTVVLFEGGHALRILGRDDDGLLSVELDADDPWAMINAVGRVPLPPYIKRAADADDLTRYQTVFARERGSVAAPTAGLHLTHATLDALRARGCTLASVTLHVGPGTFQPVTAPDLDEHRMHAEWYLVPDEAARTITEARAAGRPIVAIGTTTVRTLESWSLVDTQRAGETRLLIQPGFQFRVVDHLLTNLHLPRSTLLALVMAFAGEDVVRSAYASAVAESYRFFSYGDAMFLRSV